MKVIKIAIISLILVFLSTRFVLAKSTPTPSPSPTAASQEVNSFELFWPIVAGKTRGDTLYFLKSRKEKIRGYLIFGVPQKADYYSLLVTKRSVEAEKLLKEGKVDLVRQTIKEASSLLDAIDKSVKDNSSFPPNTLASFNTRMGNLEKFLPWLSEKYGVVGEDLKSLFEKVKSLNEKI